MIRAADGRARERGIGVTDWSRCPVGHCSWTVPSTSFGPSRRTFAAAPTRPCTSARGWSFGRHGRPRGPPPSRFISAATGWRWKPGAGRGMGAGGRTRVRRARRRPGRIRTGGPPHRRPRPTQPGVADRPKRGRARGTDPGDPRAEGHWDGGAARVPRHHRQVGRAGARVRAGSDCCPSPLTLATIPTTRST